MLFGIVLALKIDHSVYTETMVLNMGILLTFKFGRVIRNQMNKDALGMGTHRLQPVPTKLAIRKQGNQVRRGSGWLSKSQEEPGGGTV